MVYTVICTTAEIAAHYQGFDDFTTATRPTALEVGQWCSEATSLIYSAISAVYVVPVTDADALNTLKSICKKYVLPYVDRELTKNRINAGQKGPFGPKKIDHNDFHDWIKWIVDGQVKLPNTANSSSVSAYSYTAANSITAEATKETAQW